MKNTGTVDWKQEGSIGWLVFNRPEKLNSITGEMALQLRDHSTRINEDPSVRVVIIRGKGDRSFTTGTDLGQMDSYRTTWEIRNRLDYCEALMNIRKPVIAAVNGHALGGGLEVLLCCDIRIAAENATIGAPEIKLGWHAGESTQLLPRLLGYGQALRLLLTGDSVDAMEAHEIGLVEEVVALPSLDERASEIAGKIASNAPIAVEITKHLARNAVNLPASLGSLWQADLQGYCFSTQDSAEGLSAFKDKRPPEFKGK